MCNWSATCSTQARIKPVNKKVYTATTTTSAAVVQPFSLNTFLTGSTLTSAKRLPRVLRVRCSRRIEVNHLKKVSKKVPLAAGHKPRQTGRSAEWNRTRITRSHRTGDGTAAVGAAGVGRAQVPRRLERSGSPRNGGFDQHRESCRGERMITE